MQSNLSRLLEVQQLTQVDAFLLTYSPTVRHLSGYFFNYEAGPSPFHLLPAALVAVPGHGANLVVADTEGGQLSAVDASITVKPYASYAYESPLDFTRNFLEQLHQAFNLFKVRKARLGIEPNSLPLAVAESLRFFRPEVELVDVAQEVARLRLIKDPDELEMIRQSVHLCDIGQEAVLRLAKPGITELELFHGVRACMEAAAGKRIMLMADLVSGPRTGEAGGNPSTRVIEPGDLILSDLTPCLDGYWGDTCNTMSVGPPTAFQAAMFQRVKETLDLGIQALRPGVKASAIDRLMREHLAELGTYSHHSGHGVGGTYHEEPRITPYNDLELAPNMVMALEPGVYVDRQGVRLEHVALVTEGGCEVLSQFKHCLSAE